MNKYNHTFFKFMHDLIDSGIWAKLSATARTLYPVLCRFTNESFKAVWPGTDELLRLTGFKTKRSLQQAKKELVDAGLIDIIPGTGRTSTRYYFRFDYPNSSINLDTYRDTIVSLRGESEYAPGGYESKTKGGMNVPPNNIHININTNHNKKQETLLKNIENLLEGFLEQNKKTYSNLDKNQIIQTMLNKYGELEIGEAIKIAIKRGKNGDINYLEGILKNRKQSSEKPAAPANSIIEQLLQAKYPQFNEYIQPYYVYNNTHYYKSDAALPKNEIEQYLAQNGHNVKIICNDETVDVNMEGQKKTINWL